jgi:GT2 family glycosyltransferase
VSPRLGCVLLTMGDRPREVQRAVDSVRAQRDVDVDVLVVCNADVPPVEVDGARVVPAGGNLGIPAGRNLGMRHVDGEVVLFLDDDAWLDDEWLAAEVVARFDVEPALGVVSLRIADERGRTGRRHVPRLRAGDPARPSEVTTFLGGACAVRRAAFEAAGGFPEEFFYAHEETSLAWRMIEDGWRLRYAADLLVRHPWTTPTRHPAARRLSARNRVLLARRHLRLPVAPLYVLDWIVLTLLRDPTGWRDLLRGTVEGVRWRDVPRRPLSWRALGRLTLRGRPPLL